MNYLASNQITELVADGEIPASAHSNPSTCSAVTFTSVSFKARLPTILSFISRPQLNPLVYNPLLSILYPYSVLHHGSS